MSMRRFLLIGCVLFFMGGICLPSVAHAAKKSKKTKDSKSGKSTKSAARGEPSAAKTFDEAIAEGEERSEAMDHPSALNSYKKAEKLAKTDEEKNKAYTGLSVAYNNCGLHKDAVDASLMAVKYPPAADGSEAAEAARVKYIDDTYKEAYRISQAVMKDWALSHKICSQALETKDFNPTQKVEWYVRDMNAYAEEQNPKKVDFCVEQALAVDGLLPKDKFDVYRAAGHRYGYTMGIHKGSKDETIYAKSRDYYNLALNVPDAKLNTTDQAEMLYRIGESYRWVKRFSDGREYQAKVLALNPAPGRNMLFSATIETGRCYKDEGDKSNARKWFEDALAIADKTHNETDRAVSDKELKSLE